MEYRTISEVVNPLYIRATQITRNRWFRDLVYILIYTYISYIHVISRQDEDEEKKEKKQLGRETRICFWSQVHCFTPHIATSL